MAARMAIMAMTTRSSIRVNPCLLCRPIMGFLSGPGWPMVFNQWFGWPMGHSSIRDALAQWLPDSAECGGALSRWDEESGADPSRRVRAVFKPGKEALMNQSPGAQQP